MEEIKIGGTCSDDVILKKTEIKKRKKRDDEDGLAGVFSSPPKFPPIIQGGNARTLPPEK